jgi:mevalonate kinase
MVFAMKCFIGLSFAPLIQTSEYFSHGKLLISGEYLILEGAEALAIPTVFGQSMSVELLPTENGTLKWTALDSKGKNWFYAEFTFPHFKVQTSSDDALAKIIKTLLLSALDLSVIDSDTTIEITTKLDFDRNWGLGSSSTLISNLAKWSGANPFQLLAKTFGGSGYDIAVAMQGQSLIYQLDHGKPKWEKVVFNPTFANELLFVWLEQKQSSRKAIAKYKRQCNQVLIDEISSLTRVMAGSNDIREFEECLTNHEQILSGVLKQPTIKQERFSSFPGVIKSLGAWGGDFILTTRKEEARVFFRKIGLERQFEWDEMILK